MLRILTAWLTPIASPGEMECVEFQSKLGEPLEKWYPRCPPRAIPSPLEGKEEDGGMRDNRSIAR